MRRVLTSKEARDLERAAIASGASIEDLMERAGHAVARAALGVAGGAYGRRAVVLAGKGNNAGDGFVAARYLSAWGMSVSVLTLAEEGELGEPAATNFGRLASTDVRVRPFSEATAERELGRASVAVDAIFGLGLRGPPKDPYAAAISALANHGPIVCVDLPSGIDADTAHYYGTAVHPAVTVTFGAPKVGNVLPPGAYPIGSRLEIADIGYPPEVTGDTADVVRRDWPLALAELGDASLPTPRDPERHKRDAVVLVVGGSRRMTGAPCLVASAAYRSGAGLVTVAVPEGILPVVQGAIREATFLPLPEDTDGVVTEAAWDALADVISSVHVVAIGPGLSTSGEAPALVRRVIRESPVPVVIDADGINTFAGRASELRDRAADAVLTPHHGELARLMGTSSDEVRDDLVGAVRNAAAETEAPVLLKGWPTLVATPDGRVTIERSGTPVLATAGTGDVLTGMIAAFIAPGVGFFDEAYRRGLARPETDALSAAQVHGIAGQIAGGGTGEGAVASDVVDAIPEAIRFLREDV